MLKKTWLFLFVFLAACTLQAQVSVLSVVDEDKHTQKEDFWHTFEYYVIPSQGGQVGKCQATRVAKNWFATAAHCVAERCAKGCTLRMDLLEQPVSAFVSALHTDKNPAVFVHPLYDGSSRIPVAHDFALLKMNLSVLPSRYYLRPQGEDKLNTQVSRAYFEQYLRTHPVARREFQRAIRPDLPPLLTFDNVTRRIDRKLSVVSIFDGKRSILHNPNTTDYVKELGFAYTKNFGVKKGMSGSGVMTNTGELAGIISAYLGVGVSGKSAGKEYFMFAVFNPDLLEFMAQTMGSDYDKIERKDAYPNYVTRSKQDHQEIIGIVQRMQKIK